MTPEQLPTVERETILGALLVMLPDADPADVLRVVIEPALVVVEVLERDDAGAPSVLDPGDGLEPRPVTRTDVYRITS